ncbi:SGNH/GDSL hydrolase family protein [Candidatus Daviesbacteria bacterium]|nr:SGNH/GDSL hydrolase family protein [Candidatus Daviesbacteria bacterium]
MLKRKKFILILIFISLIPLFATIYFFQKQIPERKTTLGITQSKNPNPTIVFVGDSMTEYLGNFDELRGYLKKFFPDKKFLLLNYGFGSTNILSVLDRLERDSDHAGRIFQAINNIPFDLILIESFGHNPLSEYPLEEGLKLQEEALDKIIASITQKHPKSSIVFVATIAPNNERYAEGTTNLTDEKRREWAEERVSYIKNHIKYAKIHNIPLVNIYEQSLDKNGTGNIDYINSNDFIHPSPTGVYFISEKIAKFLYQNNFF